MKKLFLDDETVYSEKGKEELEQTRIAMSQECDKIKEVEYCDFVIYPKPDKYNFYHYSLEIKFQDSVEKLINDLVLRKLQNFDAHIISTDEDKVIKFKSKQLKKTIKKFEISERLLRSELKSLIRVYQTIP